MGGSGAIPLLSLYCATMSMAYVCTRLCKNLIHLAVEFELQESLQQSILVLRDNFLTISIELDRSARQTSAEQPSGEIASHHYKYKQLKFIPSTCRLPVTLLRSPVTTSAERSFDNMNSVSLFESHTHPFVSSYLQLPLTSAY